MNYSEGMTESGVLQYKDPRTVLDDIARALSAEMERRLENPGRTLPGLLDGLTGILMFFNRYGRHSDGCCSALHERLLDTCLERIGAGFDTPTYCSGLSGILYALSREYEGEVDISDGEPVYGAYLGRCAAAFLRAGNWDFLHGALGVGCYFLHRGASDETHGVILDYLESKSERVGQGRKVISVVDHKTGRRGYNISLSHGMSAAVVYLARLYALSSDGRAAELAEGFVNYILAQRMDFRTRGSCFPSMSLEDGNSKSRLGWCYGDLGVARAIFQAGRILGRDDWQESALEVMSLNCGRHDLHGNYVMDACVCHGTAGIALVFRRMFKDTGVGEFREAADYWLERTLEMACFEDGAAGYKYYVGTDGSLRSEYSLLEGICGVGLTLLAFMYDEQWDDILFI